MKITCATEDGNVTEIEVEKSTTFEDMKALIAVAFQIEPARLVLSYKNDSSIPDSETVGNQGIEDNDMLLVIIKETYSKPPRNPPRNMRRANPNAAPSNTQNLATPGLSTLDGLLPPHLRGIDISALFGPPSEAEIQRRKENTAKINENYEIAMRESPESFVPVYMLYVDVEINGHIVKGFVDSGAQTTIMSKKCAQEVGLTDMIDPRFAGVAMGVGKAKIIGKVHLVPVKIGDTFYNCSFSVLDQVQNVDFLIGLDLLKRYQCSIDLGSDCLRIGTTGKVVPFLPESELPDHARLNKKKM